MTVFSVLYSIIFAHIVLVVERIKKFFKNGEQYGILPIFYKKNKWHPIMTLSSSFKILLFFLAASLALRYSGVKKIQAIFCFLYIFFLIFLISFTAFKVFSLINISKDNLFMPYHSKSNYTFTASPNSWYNKNNNIFDKN